MTSSHAVAETRRNFEARYPQTLDRFERLLQGVVVAAEASQPGVAWSRSQELPEEDAPILAAAVAARADVPVTGDRTHFGHLFKRTAGGVQVLSLADTLALVLREKRTGPR
jgi:predicted nucleic acid-binding protein